MGGQQRILLLTLILAIITVILTGSTLFLIQDTMFEERRQSLVELAHSQARLIEAVGRFDALHSQGDVKGGAIEATIGQAIAAHDKLEGFGETGEFVIGRRNGNRIEFLLNQRNASRGSAKTLLINSEYGEPMQLALAGKSGSIIALDYSGVEVLAAYEPVKGLGVGIVAKMDISEVHAPIFFTGLISTVLAVLLIVIGVYLIRRVSNPILNNLEQNLAQQEKLVRQRTAELEAELEERAHAEKEQERAQSLLKDAIESISDGFVIYDEQDKLVICNEQYRELYPTVADIMVEGTTYEEILDQATELNQFPEGDSNAKERLLAEHLNPTGKPILRRLDADKWIQSKERKTANGGVVGIRTDVTDFKNAELELRKLNAAVEQSSSIVVITDKNGSIEYVNPKFTEVTGYFSSEVLGRNPNILKSGETSETDYKVLWETILDGREWVGEFLNLKKDGTPYWAASTISPIISSEGEITHFLAIKEDITDRKESDAALREKMDELEEFNKIAVGRELRMIELKAEINNLLLEMD